jgi:carboxyl-terminal processing protease
MSKVSKYLFAGCITVVLVAGIFSGGLIAGWFLNANRGAAATGNIIELPQVAGMQAPEAQAPQDTEALFSPFWEAWQLVHDKFVDQPVDNEALMRGAIRGMMDALDDQHSSYMDPDEFKQANMPMDGEYDGIGAYVDTSTDYLTITSPMPGSPAEKAGLKPGDMIIAVDGEDKTGIDASIVLRSVLGPAGSKVVLTIAREGEEKPFDVEITRAKITLKSVEYRMLDDQIAYVQLTSFGEKTTDDLKAALKDLLAQQPKSMVLDLRNNGGGYVDTAVEVVSQFVKDGMVMIEDYGDGRKETLRVRRGGLATEIPLVVLVNEGTASASEITAGAIQDYGRGKVVGAKTYGKGSMQEWIPLQEQQGAVRITVARWLTPKERQIHQIGLTPDVLVEMTEEDYKAERDPQLDKAVEILKGQ